MTAFLWYILKVAIVSGLLYGYYFLALKEKDFHTWNRFYLLSAVFLSFLLPWISIPLESASFEGSATRLLQSVTFQKEIIISPLETSHSPQWIYWLQAGYVTVCAIFLIIFITKILHIFRIRRSYPKTRTDGLYFVMTKLPEAPFSFLNTIYWNENINPDSATGQKIFRHELTHVRDKHSIDIIALNLVTALFWINPFFWIIKKDLSAVHEFIADRKAIDGSDTQTFVKMILSTVYGQRPLSIAHNFFNTSIKRRLNMIRKNNQKKSGLWSRFLVLPVLALIFLGVSCNVKQDQLKMAPPKIVEDNPVNVAPDEAVISPPASGQQADTNGSDSMIFTKVEREATFPGGPGAWQKYITEKIKGTIDKFTDKDYGTAVISFVVDRNGNISDVNARTMQGTLLATVAIDAIRKGPKWIPAEVNGQKVNAYRMQPITLKQP